MDEYQASDRQLAYGAFIARNRNKIRTGIRFGLLAIDVIIFVVVGVLAIQTIMLEISLSSVVAQIKNGVVSYASVREETPEGIQVLSTDVFETGEIFVDVIAKVKNPNPDWAAYQATYSFTVGGREVTGTTQILPGEVKYVAVSNIDVGRGTTVSSPNITFTDIAWERITQPTLVPKEKWEVSKATYETVSQPSEESTGSGRVAATVSNGSIYGFREAEILAVLELNGEPVGVRIQRTGQWDSFKKKDLQFTWPMAFAFGVEPVIQVDTNVLDEQNILTSAE